MVFQKKAKIVAVNKKLILKDSTLRDDGYCSNRFESDMTPENNLDQLVKCFLCARMPCAVHDALNQDILGEVPEPLKKVFQNTLTTSCEADVGIIKGMVQNLVDSLNEALVKTTERRAILKDLLYKNLEDYLLTNRMDRILRSYIPSFKKDIKVLAATEQKYKKSQYVQGCRLYLTGMGMEGSDGLLSDDVISLAHYPLESYGTYVVPYGSPRTPVETSEK